MDSKQKLALLLASLTAQTTLASTPIEKANNQATINVSYIPTQINNAPIVDGSNYLKGHELGLNMTFTKLFYRHIYAQMGLNTMAGNLSYGRHTFRSTDTSFVQNGFLRLGYLFSPREQIGLIPYATLGYQDWQMDGAGKFDKGLQKNGFTKFNLNGFYGIGLLSQFAIDPRLVLSADATFGRTFNPWTHYNAPDVPNAIVGKNVIYQSLFTSPQPFYQVGVGADYAINEKIHANAGVQYNHMEVGSGSTNPSQLTEAHLSVAQWNYHAGVGLIFDPVYDSMLHYYNTTSDAIVKANNQASLWYGYIFQNYGETSPGLDYYFDREVKNIPAINMVMVKTFENVYSQFNLLFAGGNTAYKSTSGTTNTSGSPPTNDSTRNTLLSTSLRLGYQFFPNDKVGLTPYIMGGYRRWLRDLAGSPDSGFILDGYSETYQFAFYSLGLMFQYSPHPKWVLNVDGNAGTMENVTNKSWTIPIDASNTNQKLLTLKQRFIYNLGVGADYRFAQNWHALLQLNYLYFKFGRSANSKMPGDQYWYEPNSTTRQLSIMAGIGYAFA